jgi:hypothetical protein
MKHRRTRKSRFCWFGCLLLASAQFASAHAAATSAVEFYHAGFDHYFVTRSPEEIQALESGRLIGWSRTGRAFAVFATAADGGPGANPVCRFYIPPQKGDSHFFSASMAECTEVLGKIPSDPNYAGYLYESPDAWYSALPNTATGACPAGTVPVYRLWNQRGDSNHRYTADPGIKSAMLAKGYLAEGYGDDAVSMCTPMAQLVDAFVRVSGLSSFAPGCEAPTGGGTPFVSSEVEPYIAVNPANPNNLIAVWQQDRMSNGGARGNGGAVSFDGGGTWTRFSVPFSRCSGGNAANGGDYQRATDPWVTFAPDGTAYQSALAFSGSAFGGGSANAITVSRSIDGGRTWSNPVALIQDGPQAFNDKEAITADPTDARYVYVVWDRLVAGNGGGPTWFARTVDGGTTWEPARIIHDPGVGDQTIGNVVAVLPDGTLVNVFNELVGNAPTTATIRVIRSVDKGATWSAPITVSALQAIGVVDPDSGIPIRDGSLLPVVAAGKDGTLAMAWQDARFSGGARDAIAFSRSFDGGLTWTAPLRINGDPAVPAFIPTVAIGDDGTIGVTYYDLRSNTPDPGTLPADFWLVTSTDGVSWTERRVAGPFDYAQAPVAGGALFLGDYMGLAAVGTSFVPLFGMTTGAATNRADMYAALLRAPAPSMAAEGKRVRTALAPPLPATPAMAERIDRNVRAALARRLPGMAHGEPR